MTPPPERAVLLRMTLLLKLAVGLWLSRPT
jgi:hypothetical protein